MCWDLQSAQALASLHLRLLGWNQVTAEDVVFVTKEHFTVESLKQVEFTRDYALTDSHATASAKFKSVALPKLPAISTTWTTQPVMDLSHIICLISSLILMQANL